MSVTYAAAVDLGATSGRVIVGAWKQGRVTLTEVHRFPNAFQTLQGRSYWDVGGLFREIVKGLLEAKRQFPTLASIGVDSWAVDHVLVDRAGRLVYPVHAYRDTRTQAAAEALSEKDQKKLYRLTGLPPYPYNTSFQLQETFRACPSLRLATPRALFIADYFNFLLSGKMENEFSLCSHSQLLEVKGKNWSREAFRAFEVPWGVLGKPCLSPQALGEVQGIAELQGVKITLVPGHDTACAFAAMPAAATGDDLFLSTGTWSLMGFESDEPVVGEEARKARISNERAGDGRYRPLCSTLGLWLWEKVSERFPKRPKTDQDWRVLIAEARALPEPEILIDTSDARLFNPDDMRSALEVHLKEKGARRPKNLAAYLRLISASLGESHALAAQRLATLSGRTFRRILMVGGGSKNPLLAQATADRTGLPVRALSLEGSAVGNLAHQWISLGVIRDLGEFRHIFDKQCKGTLYHPKNSK